MQEDNRQIVLKNNLLFLAGKGANHEADVLVEPPLQIPFTNPSRIVFECKAYRRSKSIGIDVLRQAYGLREDVNNFEILSQNEIDQRTNSGSISPPTISRYHYQIGVAALNSFSKPAREFALRNKISLLSIRELFSDDFADRFRSITDESIRSYSTHQKKNLS